MLFSHLIGDRVLTVTGTTVDAGAKHEMRTCIAGLAAGLPFAFADQRGLASETK